MDKGGISEAILTDLSTTPYGFDYKSPRIIECNNKEHCLLLMLEKWKHAVDNKKVFGALLTGSSKAFDCICHDLLIAKLNAYGLSLPALKLVHNYLQNRKQKKKEWYFL